MSSGKDKEDTVLFGLCHGTLKNSLINKRKTGMKEALLQYIWQYKMFNATNLRTEEGESVEIIDYGQKNGNAGPDFFNAKIRIGDTMWAGNVEIHILASDWLRHGHDKDKRYDSVILHVVADNDHNVTRQNGEHIPTLQIHISEEIERRHQELYSRNNQPIKCSPYWKDISKDYLKIYFSKMLNERLFRKSQQIEEEVEKRNGDWEEVLYHALAKSLGMGVNSLPFEQLAISTPLRYIAKHRDNLFQLEALLMGQAGLLFGGQEDDYLHSLKEEYMFLQQKFSLAAIQPTLWIFAKMRPVNFPHIRVAELAALLNKTEHLFSKVMEADHAEGLRSLLTAKASSYWDSHYTFQEASPHSPKKIGRTSIDLIIINAIIPILFAYAQKREDYALQDRALDILDEIRPEKNHIISEWETLGITINSAYDTQALLEIKKRYCDRNDCLRCGLAHKILEKAKKIRN